MTKYRLVIIFIGILCLTACQGTDLSEYYGNLIDTPGGLSLTKEEHSYGWGESNCYICHTPNNFHQSQEERSTQFDMQQVRDRVAVEGLNSCSTCHGSNGVASESSAAISYEYYGDLLETPSGLILEKSEHRFGWGENNCYACHRGDLIHQPLPQRSGKFEMEAIAAIARENGLTICAGCHGNNGVSD